MEKANNKNASSSKNISVFKLAEYAGFFILLCGVVFCLRLLINEEVLEYSVVASINIVTNSTVALISAIVILELMIDNHDTTKQSVLFFLMALSIGLTGIGDSVFSAYYLVFNNNSVAAFIDIAVLVLALAYFFMSLEYAMDNMEMPKDKQKRPRIIWILILIFYACTYIVNTWGGIRRVTPLFIFSLFLPIVYYFIFIRKNSRSIYEAISLIAMCLLGTVVSVLSSRINNLVIYSIGDLCGMFLCLSNMYLKRSNSLSDTQKDLDLAASVQLDMLPDEFRIPDLDTIDIFASMRPAHDIGGDFYDFYRISKKHIAFVIADVSGKGVQSAMMMMRAITSIKNYAMAGFSVDKLMEKVSSNINDHNEEMLFVTVWMGMLNLEKGKLMFVNAGHNPPLLRHGDGRVEAIKTDPDKIIGVFPGAKYTRHTIYLEPGDTVFLYTDGITSASNSKKEQFGAERLMNTVSKPYEGSKQLCQGVAEAVDSFAAREKQMDDMTMLSVKYIGPNNHLTDNFVAYRSDIGTETNAKSDYLANVNIMNFEESEASEAMEIEIIKS